MKYFLVVFLFLSTYLRAEWEQLFSVDEDPTLFHHVNVITGNLNLAFEDGVVSGAKSLPIIRTYSSAGALERTKSDFDIKLKELNHGWLIQGGWNYFPYTNLLIEPACRKEDFIAYLPEKGGNPIRYKYHHRHKSNPYLIFLKADGGSNSSHFTARTDPQNNWLILDLQSGWARLSLPDGGKRTYRGRKFYNYKKKRLPLPKCYYHISDETTPSQHKITYGYDSNRHLTSIHYLNPKGDKLFSSINFHNTELSPFKFHIHTSDGKELFYEAIEHEKRDYLNHTKGNYRPSEMIQYIPGRKGIGARMGAVFLEGKLQYQIDYVLPSNKKEERKWNKDSSKIDFSGDKVAKIEAPISSYGELIPIAKFTYHSDFTEVRESENLLIRYHHQNNQLTQIEYFDKKDQLRSVQKFSYQNGRTSSRALLDASGQELQSQTYEYDERGNVIKETLWGNLTGEGRSSRTKETQYTRYGNLPYKESEEDGLTYFYHYLHKSDLLHLKRTTDQGHTLIREFFFYDQDNLLIKQIIDNGSSNRLEDETGVTQRVIHSYERDPSTGMPIWHIESYLDLQTKQEILLKKRAFFYKNNKLVKEAIYDASGLHRYTLEIEYDAYGNIIRKTDPLGRSSFYRYNPLGHLLQSEEAGSPKKIFQYNSAGRPVSCQEIDHLGESRTSYSLYDFKGRLLKQTDTQSHTTYQNFDTFGNLLTMILPSGIDENNLIYNPVIQFSYDILGNIISTTTEGATTYTSYNLFRKPTQITEPDGSITSHTYYKNGTLACTRYPDQIETHYCYDSFQRVISKKILSSQKELLSEESWHYNAFQLLSYTNPEGLTTYYFYDGAGRKICEKTGERSITYSYDALGFLEKTVTAGGKAHIQIHDVAGRVIEEYEEELGVTQNRMRFFYNRENLKEKIIRDTSQGEAVDTLSYDGQGRLMQHTDPLGNSSRVTYTEKFPDLVKKYSLQKTSFDPLNNATIETYDLNHHLVLLQKKNPQGDLIAEEKYFYDRVGNKKRQESTLFQDKQPIKKIPLSWEYDIRGRVISQKEAGEKITTYSYDIQGRLKEKKLPSGVTFYYHYDGLGRLLELISSDKTIHTRYLYAKSPQPIHISDLIHSLSIDLEYNQFGELIQETGLHNYRWRYDAQGKREQFVLPDRSSIHYHYQGSHLSAVQRYSSSHILQYEHRYLAFDLNEHLTEESLIHNLGTIDIQHDLLERLSTLSSPFVEASITYGPSGLITQINNSLTGDKEYSYDSLNQLLQEGTEEYHFDSLGNPIQWKTNDHNQITSTLDTVFSYDLNGNPTTRENQKETIKYDYDALGRLISITSSTKKIEFLYDPLSRLHQKTTLYLIQGEWVIDSTLNYLHDQNFEIGTLQKDKILQLKVMGLGIKGDIGAAIAIECNKNTYAPIHDFSGNIIALLNTQGKIIEQYQLDAFGKENSQEKINPWRFNSKRHEEGLIFFGHRFYDPALGRWLTPDPAGYTEGPNLYAYVLNSPLNRLDLFGFVSEMRAPYALPSLSLEVKLNQIGQNDHFVTAEAYIDRKGPYKVDFGCDWAKMQYTPEELKVNRINVMDHLSEITPKNTGAIGILSFSNGINVSPKEYNSYSRFLHEAVPELSNGMLYFGFYNPSKGFCRDFWRLTREHHSTKDTSNIKLLRQYIVAVSDRVNKINPSLLWLHISHSEAGLVTRRVIEGMTPDQQSWMKQHFISLSLGSVAPMPSSYVKDRTDIISSGDHAAKSYQLGYQKKWYSGCGGVIQLCADYPSIQTVPAQVPLFGKGRVGRLVDHNFLSPTYRSGAIDEIKDNRRIYGFYSNQSR